MSLRIGNRFLVLSPFEAIDAVERIPIILGPGQAFGSGGHETTRSCLEELENIPLSGKGEVLDLGCGTGILSIAAAKLGAESVIALDPDPRAIKATVSNIKLNRVEKIVFPLEGELEMVKNRCFHLIMANLYGDILLSLVNDIQAHLEPGGQLLLSGIEYEYAYDLRRGFSRAECKLLKIRYLEEYTTLIFKRSLARA